MNMVKLVKRFTLVVLTSLTFSVTAIAAENGSAGVVVSSTGKVSAKGGVTGKRELSRGDDFYVEDVISTDSGATVSLRFLDGSIVDLMGLSEYKVSEYHFSEADPSKDTFSSELIKGGLRSVSGKIGERNPNKVQVNSQMTTLTIRGTGWTQAVGSCDVMQTISAVQRTCNNIVFEVDSGSVTVLNRMTNESVTLDSMDELRGLVVTNRNMDRVENITPTMYNDIIGEGNYFRSSQQLQGEQPFDGGSVDCTGGGLF